MYICMFAHWWLQLRTLCQNSPNRRCIYMYMYIYIYREIYIDICLYLCAFRAASWHTHVQILWIDVVYMCICIYTYIHMNIYTYIYMCLYLCALMPATSHTWSKFFKLTLYIYVNTCIYKYTYLCMSIFMQYIHVYIFLYIHMYICLYFGTLIAATCHTWSEFFKSTLLPSIAHWLCIYEYLSINNDR